MAKNGQEFANMTKLKQKGNPKFSFLFGGNYNDYYNYRLTNEQLCKRDINYVNIFF